MKGKIGLLIAILSVAFTGCGSGGSSSSTASIATTYSISGTVSGLSGTVELQDNGADDLSVSANGAFIFATMIVSGATYSVTVKTQPAGQTCTVTNGTGVVCGANVTNVAVTCVTVILNEVHNSVLISAFLLTQQNVVESTIQVYVKDPGTGSLITLPASDYLITPAGTNTQITILSVSPVTLMSDPAYLYEIHVSYSYRIN